MFSISFELNCFSSSKSLIFLFLLSIKSVFSTFIASNSFIFLSNSLLAASISKIFLESSSFLAIKVLISSNFFSILFSRCKLYSSFNNLSFLKLSNLSLVTACSVSLVEITSFNSLFLESIKIFCFFTSSFSKSIVVNLFKVLSNFSCKTEHSSSDFILISSFSTRFFSFCSSSVMKIPFAKDDFSSFKSIYFCASSACFSILFLFSLVSFSINSTLSKFTSIFPKFFCASNLLACNFFIPAASSIIFLISFGEEFIILSTFP